MPLLPLRRPTGRTTTTTTTTTTTPSSSTRITKGLIFLLLLLAVQPTVLRAQEPEPEPDPASGGKQRGFLASVADRVGAAVFGMGQGKAFGPRAAAVLNKPLHCTTGWEREERTETATFAAGCFWGVELSFQRVPGVISTRVGYIGGHTPNPTYQQVCSGTTGHAEAVEVVFDPDFVTYPELLTILWDRHDPTQLNRQGNDVGTQYRSAIFYHSEEQRRAAEASIQEEQARRPRPIVTELVPASTFYPAEAYHQQYLEKGGQCTRKGDTTPIRCYG